MKWRLYICANCDTDEGVLIKYVPDDRHPESSLGVPDFCPGCDSHHGLISMGDVEVSGNSLIHLRGREPAET